MPKINAAGLALIKEFEGCCLTAYPDPGTGAQPWTIGYGHTNGVRPGETITQEQAEQYLQNDLVEFQVGVNNLVARDLTPNQFAALVSFAYNLGLGALEGSTLLAYVNAGDFTAAQGEFEKWVFAGGKILPGLVRRRAAEAALFGTP
jgi:lysozyme